MVFSAAGAGAGVCAWAPAAPDNAAAATNHFDIPISFSCDVRTHGDHSGPISVPTTFAAGYRDPIPGVGSRETSGAAAPAAGAPLARRALHNVSITAFMPTFRDSLGYALPLLWPTSPRILPSC